MILWEVREQTPGCFAELRISRNVEMLLEQQSSCTLMTFMLMHGSLRIRCKVQKVANVTVAGKQFQTVSAA